MYDKTILVMIRFAVGQPLGGLFRRAGRGRLRHSRIRRRDLRRRPAGTHAHEAGKTRQAGAGVAVMAISHPAADRWWIGAFGIGEAAADGELASIRGDDV